MGLTEKRRTRLEQRRIRFGNTHLGAKRASGNAGTFDFPYISYSESNAAGWLEVCSILSVIFGMGLMYTMLQNAEGFAPYLWFAAGIFLVNRAFALLAWKVNNVQVRRRIVNDTDYAFEFAYKYPEQAHICGELNPAYAANPDAVPAEQIREKLRQESRSFDRTRRLICIAGLSLLVLILIGAIIFCRWVIRETSGL